MPSRVIYAPRSYQREPQNDMRKGCRRFNDVWHRRGGKDKTWLNIQFEESQKFIGIYYHIFPSLNQGRRDIWDNIGSDGIPFMDMFPNELVKARNELEMQVEFRNGSRYQIMGADDRRAIARMRGSNPRGLVYSEFGNMDVAAWDTLSPVLAENGGWAAFIYTPPDELPACCVTGQISKNRCKGNHAKLYYELAAGDPSWHCSKKTVDDTYRDAEGESGGHVITPEALEQERKEHDEAYIQREFYCEFETPVAGSYYGKLLAAAVAAGRVCYVPLVKSLPVHLVADLGAKKITMAFGAFQIVNAGIRWLKTWSDLDLGLPEYAAAIKAWGRENDVVFGTTYFPHDAAHHEIGTGKTRIQTWRGLGFKNIHQVQKLDPADGIAVVKRMMPAMYWNLEETADFRQSLKTYHEKNNRPVDDDSSHYADMCRYACVGVREPKQEEKPVPKYANTQRDPYGRGPVEAKYASHGEGIFGRNR